MKEKVFLAGRDFGLYPNMTIEYLNDHNVEFVTKN